MDVEVFDVDLAAAGAQFAGKEFGESGCPFRTQRTIKVQASSTRKRPRL